MANRLNIPVPICNARLRRDAEVTLPRADECTLKGVGWVAGKSAARTAEPRQYPDSSDEGIVEVIQLPRKAS